MDSLTLDGAEYTLEFFNDGDSHDKSINCTLSRWGREVASAYGKNQHEALTRALSVLQWTQGRY